jgi:hypothetical protein
MKAFLSPKPELQFERIDRVMGLIGGRVPFFQLNPSYRGAGAESLRGPMGPPTATQHPPRRGRALGCANRWKHRLRRVSSSAGRFPAHNRRSWRTEVLAAGRACSCTTPGSAGLETLGQISLLGMAFPREY